MLSFFKTDHIPDHTDDVDDVIKKMDTIDEVDYDDDNDTTTTTTTTTDPNQRFLEPIPIPSTSIMTGDNVKDWTGPSATTTSTTTKSTTTKNTKMIMVTNELPAKEPTPQEEVALLSKELNEMSVLEREQLYEEIHGVDEDIVETPELLARSFQELDQHLIAIKTKPAYDLAYQLSKDFVTDPKFRLLFLRSERFHPQRTARKMVGYFEYKCDLFGADKLVKKITLDDLSKDDRTTLQTGAMQILPNRDKSGRAVFFECQKFWRTIRYEV